MLWGTLPGQDQMVLPGSHMTQEGSTSTNVPFGRSVPMRVQMVYDGRLFQGPVAIQEISFRLNGGNSALAKQVELEMRMSTLPGSILGTDHVFAANRGVDEVRVFDRQVVSLPALGQAQTPNPFHLRLPLNPSFAYDPDRGSLVLEMIVHAQEPGPYTLDTTYVCASPHQAVGPPACQSSGGATLKVESASSQVMWGRSLVFRVFDAKPGALTGLVLGTRDTGNWNGWDLPQDLAVLGAPGCFASISIDLTASQIASGSGSASYVFSLPSEPALQGLWIYFQGSAVDVGANPLGVVTSRAGRVQVCGWEPVARVYANGTAATTGLREIGVAPVIHFSIR